VCCFSGKYLPPYRLPPGVLCALVLALVSVAMGNRARDLCSGVVTDSRADAVVVWRTVTLKKFGTNESRSCRPIARANTLPSLLPASTASPPMPRDSRPGDQRSGTASQPDRAHRPQAAVGEVSERVEVMSSPVLLKTDTSEIGHVVTTSRL